MRQQSIFEFAGGEQAFLALATAALRSYMEWAVAQVMACSPRGSTVPSGLLVPRWSWDGLQAE